MTFRANVKRFALAAWPTILLNVLLVLVAVLSAIVQQPFIPPQFIPYIVAAIAILNIVIKLLADMQVS